MICGRPEAIKGPILYPNSDKYSSFWTNYPKNSVFSTLFTSTGVEPILKMDARRNLLHVLKGDGADNSPGLLSVTPCVYYVTSQRAHSHNGVFLARASFKRASDFSHFRRLYCHSRGTGEVHFAELETFC